MAQVISLYHILIIALITFAPAFLLGVFVTVKFNFFATAKKYTIGAFKSIEFDLGIAHDKLDELALKIETLLDPVQPKKYPGTTEVQPEKIIDDHIQSKLNDSSQ